MLSKTLTHQRKVISNLMRNTLGFAQSARQASLGRGVVRRSKLLSQCSGLWTSRPHLVNSGFKALLKMACTSAYNFKIPL